MFYIHIDTYRSLYVKYWYSATFRTVIISINLSVYQFFKKPSKIYFKVLLYIIYLYTHNDLTECGTEKDFACHKLEHELSGLFGVTHGAGLAAIWGSWARYVMNRHMDRFVKFATEVMGVPKDHIEKPLATAMAGVRNLENFFHEIGMPTNIPELIGREATEEEIQKLVDKCSRGGKITIGAMEVLKAEDMTAIYQMANRKWKKW